MLLHNPYTFPYGRRSRVLKFWHKYSSDLSQLVSLPLVGSLTDLYHSTQRYKFVPTDINELYNSETTSHKTLLLVVNEMNFKHDMIFKRHNLKFIMPVSSPKSHLRNIFLANSTCLVGGIPGKPSGIHLESREMQAHFQCIFLSFLRDSSQEKVASFLY